MQVLQEMQKWQKVQETCKIKNDSDRMGVQQSGKYVSLRRPIWTPFMLSEVVVMNRVQPIRDVRIIEGMKEYFRVRSLRDYLFFCLGIYSGLRVSDLCRLRVGDVRGSHVRIKEKKNRNSRLFIIHPSIRADLDRYIAGKKDTDYLFVSRQRKKVSRLKNQPIDRTTAYRILNEAAREFGLQEIGCHTLRKTWAYHIYKQDSGNLALLMEAFGHKDPAVTLRYIGVTQDQMDAAIAALR